MPVHYGGLCRDMPAIMEIAARWGLRVIEDAAHSFPSRLDTGQWAGDIGDAGVFSFYANKTITTGEGGMVLCRDPEAASRIALMRSHGIDRTIWNRYTAKRASWYYEVVEAGFKYNIPDVLSALGRVQLSRAWELLAARQSIARAYNGAFAADERFTLPPDGPGNAWHLYPLRLNLESLAITRDAFIEKVQEAGVGLSVHFIPLHAMPYYRERWGLEEEDLPESMRTFRRTVSLPIWAGMTKPQIEKVIRVVKAAAK